MNDNLLTIATFAQPIEAHIAKGRLEAEGILCFLGDENIISAHPFYSNAVGGVKLKVLAEDAAEAKAILARTAQEAADYLDPEGEPLTGETGANPDSNRICPNCGGHHIQVLRFSRTVLVLSLLLLGLPFPFLKRTNHCTTCGHEWRKQ